MKKKLAPLLRALILVIVGVILVLYSGDALTTILRIIGIGLLLVGVIGVAGYFLGKDKNIRSFWRMLVAAVETIIGIVILASPKFVLSLYPIVVGVLIILNGLSNLLSAHGMKQREDRSWKVMLILALITIILGIIVICNPFATVSALTSVIGAILVYDGITSAITVLKK